jgi:two-component system cell cycle sensor histidine kinase/response regulator CckA
MGRTKRELEAELASLRRRIAALENSGAEIERAQRALAESEKRYRLLADNVNDVIWSADQDLRFTYFSPSVTSLRGYSVEDALAQKVEEIMTPASYSQAMKVFSEELQRSDSDKTDRFRTRTMELEITRKDGSTVWTESRTNLLFDSDGRPVGIMGVTRDITERKAVESAMRESEEKYRSIFESIQDVYAEVSVEDGTIIEISPSIERLSGRTREEMIGKPMTDVYAHKSDRPALLRALKEHGDLSDYEVELVNTKGRAVPCSLSIRVVTDDDGKPVKTVGTMRDISARKWAEKALEKLNLALEKLNLELEKRVEKRTAELSEANKLLRREIAERKLAEAEKEKLQKTLIQAQKMEAVGTLAGGIAHDFNNLLQAIQGYAGLLLLDKEKGEPGHRELREICRAVERGGELSRRLLTFSRSVESRTLPVDMNLQVRQAYELLKRVIPKMINIELQLAPGLKIINADPIQIEQILMNLGVNARDAMPDSGTLVLRTENVTLEGRGDHVLLSVTDTGWGMDKGTLEHIYEPFFTTKEIGAGTGLGLAMVYGILKNHGGYIKCESKPGKGTTFRLYFPVIEEKTKGETVDEAINAEGGTETILLVDDEISIRDIGEESLVRFGYTVMTAEDGESGLGLFREHRDRIDLVVLDLIMPGMGGRRCLMEMLAIDPEVKVIIASGYSSKGSREEAIEAGAAEFIDKPYDIVQMLEAVRKALDTR